MVWGHKLHAYILYTTGQYNLFLFKDANVAAISQFEWHDMLSDMNVN